MVGKKFYKCKRMNRRGQILKVKEGRLQRREGRLDMKGNVGVEEKWGATEDFP